MSKRNIYNLINSNKNNSNVEKKSVEIINNMEDFLNEYTLFNQSEINYEDFEVMNKFFIYPVKNIKNNKFYFLTFNKDIKKDIVKNEDKRALHILKKFGSQNFIFVTQTIYNQLFTELSMIDKEYTTDEAKAFFQDLLTDAYRKSASDIHLAWTSSNIVIKYRIDGKIIKQGKVISLELGKALKNIFVNKSGESEYEEKEVAGQITEIIDGVKMEYRLSIGPTIYGYVIVIRAESHIDMSSTLEKWGYTPMACEMIRKLFNKHYGMILVTGATGSGKSTLLYTNIIEKVTKDSRYAPEILTVEDPVEIAIEGINQVQVNTKGKKENWITFGSAVKMFLRQDPDMIVIGEIRDKEVADEAVRAAKTGHLAASTLHTNDVKSTFTRLNELGIDNINIEDGVIGVISQKLINRLCDNCKIKNNDMTFSRNEEGCSKCVNSSVPGYKGRVPVVEIAILNNNPGNYKPENFEEYYSVEANILYLLDMGVIDLEEAKKYILINNQHDLKEKRLYLETWNKVRQDSHANLIYPVFQPIIDNKEYIIGYDLFLRVKDKNGKPLSTEGFIKTMNEINSLHNVFAFFLSSVSDLISSFSDKIAFIKLSKDLLLNKDFIESLELLLKENKRLVKHLVIKTTFSIELEDFYKWANNIGLSVAIENFVPNIEELIFIERNHLNITYIQTNKEFISGIKNSEHWVEQYINQLLALNSRIIVSFIETEKMLHNIMSMHVDKIYGYQGYAIQLPNDSVDFSKASVVLKNFDLNSKNILLESEE